MSGRVWPMKPGSAVATQPPPSPVPSTLYSWFSKDLGDPPDPAFLGTAGAFSNLWPCHQRSCTRACSFGWHISLLEWFPLGSPFLPRGHQGRAPMSRLHLGGRGGGSRRSGPLSVMGYSARNMELYFSPAWDSLFSPFLALPPACVPRCQAWQSFFICPQPREFIQSPIPTYPGCADSLREEFSTTSGQEAS